jgi:fermentation-respiration switch protein FrsA (DUF1100 family)
MGGVTAIRTAARNPEIAAVVAEGGYHNMGDNIIASISPRPVFLIYGEHEAESGHAGAQYSAALSPKDLWLVPGGSHGSNHQIAPMMYELKILDFFNRSLLH